LQFWLSCNYVSQEHLASGLVTCGTFTKFKVNKYLNDMWHIHIHRLGHVVFEHWPRSLNISYI
jgi:hypothetical protein